MKQYSRKAWYWEWATDHKAKGKLLRYFNKAERLEQKQKLREAIRLREDQ